MKETPQAEMAIKIATGMIQDLEKWQVDIRIAFAALGNAFCRIATALGHDENSFRAICEEMNQITFKKEENNDIQENSEVE
jgi:hypothetical protein